MKKRYLLLTLITIFATAVLCLFASCAIYEKLFAVGGDDRREQVGEPIGSDAVRYFHFVDTNGETLLDYYVDRNFDSINLNKALWSLSQSTHCEPSNMKWIDGTEFDYSSYKALNEYVVYNLPDCYVHANGLIYGEDDYPAFTVVCEMIPYEYEITFVDVDGATFDAPGTYNVTMVGTPLPVPSKPYYHFVGWYENSGDWNEQVAIEVYPDEFKKVTYYARWEPIVFNVVYEDEGIPNLNETVLYQKDGDYELIPIESNEGWAFHGWKLNGKYVTTLDLIELWDSSAPYGDEAAYTIVLTADLEFFRHTFDYYVDDELYRHYDLDYFEWRDFTAPSVPYLEHYTGSWSSDAAEFKDCRFDAVYEIDKYEVSIETNLSDYSPATRQYEYGTTYGDIYDQLSYTNKKLMGLYFDSDCTQRASEDDLILQDGTLYAKFEDYYAIRSASDWSLLQEHNYAYFTLENDVNFLGNAIPVISEFYGVLDGQGFKVTNFINQNSSCPVTYGLFSTNSGTISDIVFSSGIYTVTTAGTSSNTNVGFLTGINNGTVKNVRIEDTVVKITSYHYSYVTRGSVENSLYAGVFAGTNQGTIEYSTLADTVRADMNTTMFAARNDADEAYIGTWASYGLIAGRNRGTISHVTSEGSISSTASRSESNPSMFSNYYNYVYFYLRVGGIIGFNASGGVLADSDSGAVVTVDHNVTVHRKFYSYVDIGGVAGNNGGQIERCYSDENTLLTSNANAETHMGGLVGNNDTNAIARASYSRARFAPASHSETEETYCGGIVGLNNGTISYCYAFVDSVQAGEFVNSKIYFGGLFGYANDSSSIVNSFAVLNTSGLLNSNVCGYYESATVFRCYVYVTDGAGEYSPCTDVTECSAEEELLSAIGGLGYDLMGFTMSEDTYPTLPDAGNNKQ